MYISFNGTVSTLYRQISTHKSERAKKIRKIPTRETWCFIKLVERYNVLMLWRKNKNKKGGKRGSNPNTHTHAHSLIHRESERLIATEWPKFVRIRGGASSVSQGSTTIAIDLHPIPFLTLSVCVSVVHSGRVCVYFLPLFLEITAAMSRDTPDVITLNNLQSTNVNMVA